ncbi:unnamed protein product [Arabidopsis lyrata]|nr:unnamed protein product [Arabidopsis lyrata]
MLRLLLKRPRSESSSEDDSSSDEDSDDDSEDEKAVATKAASSSDSSDEDSDEESEDTTECLHGAIVVEKMRSQEDNPTPLSPSQPPFSESQTPTSLARASRVRWSVPEEKALASAWLNTSKDSVVGNEQRSAAFWDRVAAYYAACPAVSKLTIREPNTLERMKMTLSCWPTSFTIKIKKTNLVLSMFGESSRLIRNGAIGVRPNFLPRRKLNFHL